MTIRGLKLEKIGPRVTRRGDNFGEAKGRIAEISLEEVERKLTAKETFHLVDVREDGD